MGGTGSFWSLSAASYSDLEGTVPSGALLRNTSRMPHNGNPHTSSGAVCTAVSLLACVPLCELLFFHVILIRKIYWACSTRGHGAPLPGFLLIISWWQHSENLACYEQQDAHEFFISMLDRIHEKEGKARNTIRDLFS